jgi:predicted DNA-binding transcriptional regulator AlpA
MAADHSDRLADYIETLAIAIEGNTQEMKALRDAIDDLRIEYVHAIRNADCPYLAEAKAVKRILPSFPLNDALEMDLSPEQIRQAVAEGVTTAVGLRRIETNTRADAVPETIACARCDACSPESVAVALQEGWTDICRDVGAGWNYLGICSQHQHQPRGDRLPRRPLEEDGRGGHPDDRAERGLLTGWRRFIRRLGMPAVITDKDRSAPSDTPSLLLSARMLAKRLAVSVRTLWRLRSSGKLPEPVRLGGAVRWRAADIDAWVAAGCPDLQARNNGRRR